MKALRITTLALFAVALMAAMVLAEEQGQMTRDQACSLLGNCGDDMVNSAQQMMAQCENMIATAKKLKEKGIQIKTRGEIWQDQEMIDEGSRLIEQAEQMETQAKKMSDACKILLEEGLKRKKKAVQMAPDQGPEYRLPTSGDQN